MQFQLLGSFTETVSSFGQFHSETVPQLSKVSQKLAGKKKAPFGKNQVKEQFQEKLRLIFYFIMPQFQLKTDK